MAKVKINSVDYRRFEEAAEAAGTSVARWLTEAGNAQTIKKEHAGPRGLGPLDDVWHTALLELATEIRSPQDLAYLTLCRLHTIVEDTALLTAPDAFTRDVIESRLRVPVTEALSRRLDRQVHVAVTVRRTINRPRPTAAHQAGSAGVIQELERLKLRVDELVARRTGTDDQPGRTRPEKP